MGGLERKSFAEALKWPLPQAKCRLSIHKPELVNGELGFVFSDAKMECATKELKFALVLKFIALHPSIHVLSNQTIKTWGFSEVPMISFMDDHHVLLHLSNEKDYVHAWAREGASMAGYNFRIFN